MSHTDDRKFRRLVHAFLASALLLLAVAAIPASPASADLTLTVNDTGDDGDQNPGDGNCATSSGSCTLRAAVEEANASNGPDTINFNISGSGPHVIDLGETLTIQDISGGTTIDGYSQPGASVNTAEDGFNGSIEIEITTSDALSPLIFITTGENVIRGISIYGNGPRMELRGENADGNRIVGNIIGTDTTATFESTNAAESNINFNYGIALNLGPDRNQIGTPALEDRNVISGNSDFGIRVNHGETSQNVIENNVFGLTPDLGDNLRQRVGIDLQWYTWGNYVTDNLMSGHFAQAVDLSHTAVGNVVIDNRLGTLADGNSISSFSTNRWGVTFKDNVMNNWFVDNVVGASTNEEIWHKHNFTGPNNIINNRLGVGLDGADIGGAGRSMTLTGHDDLYLGNIWANSNNGGILLTNAVGGQANYDPELTLGNALLENTFYGLSGLFIDIANTGQNTNDPGDGDDGIHNLLNHPEITGIGPDEVYGTACATCTIEVYVSGVVESDGTLNTSTSAAGEGAGWIGRVEADASGEWSLGHEDIRTGKTLYAVALDTGNSTSEFSPAETVPSSFTGSGSNPDQSLGRTPVPTTPNRPPAYAPDLFTCSWSNSTLSWDDEGANEYYVRSVAADGTETYLGAFTGTSTTVPDADGYRIVNWSQGFARTAVCDGPGDVAVQVFACSYDAGTLSWTDEGADSYYVRLIDDNGNDSYFGSSTGTSLSVPPAAGYEVIHWVGGRNATTCSGPGATAAFSCSYANDTLSWTDQGVSTYFVRLVDGAGVDTYFGSTTSTSLAVPASAGYQVIHWVGGKTVATC